jgi:hypothetical protein
MADLPRPPGAVWATIPGRRILDGPIDVQDRIAFADPRGEGA